MCSSDLSDLHQRLLSYASDALHGFLRDMERLGVADRVAVLVFSEFGRRVHENGSQGTDHGHGNAMMLMGPSIAGGRVLHQWQGLDLEHLYDFADLPVRIDYRDVLAEILERRLGNTEIGTVFPGFTPTRRGVLA